MVANFVLKTRKPAAGRRLVVLVDLARREVVLLVIERIVGDVHLAVDAEERAVGVDHGGRVVVHAGAALLEDRHDEDDAELLGERAHALDDRPGDRLGEIEALGVGDLAEVGGVEELLEADDLRAALRGFPHFGDRLLRARPWRHPAPAAG